MSSNEASGESAQMRRLDKAFVAHIYKVWMYIKAQDQNLELWPHFVQHMDVHRMRLRMGDKYQNIVYFRRSQ